MSTPGTIGSNARGEMADVLPEGVAAEEVRRQLAKILSSRLLIRSERLTRFLSFAAEGALAGECDKLKEYVIGVQVFDRGDDFDPRADAIVRTEATRLRRKLKEYYQAEGRDDPIVITVPRGGYVPRIDRREDPTETPVPQPKPVPAERRAINRTALAAMLGIMFAASAAAIWWRLAGVESAPAKTLHSVPLTSLPGWEHEPALSPDGKRVAFIWNGEEGDNDDVYLGLVGSSGGPLRLTDHPAAESWPAWSPDGRRIAFLRTKAGGADLIEIPALGGPERTLAHLSAPSHDITWSPDGRFIAVEDQPPGERSGIFRISIATGERRRLTNPSAENHVDRWPAYSPDGRSLAFTRGKHMFDLYLLPLDAEGGPAGRARQVTREPFYLEGLDWLPDGRSVVFAGHFDVPWWRLWNVDTGTGKPVPLDVEGGNAKQPTTLRRRDGAPAGLAYVAYSSDSNIHHVPGPGAGGAGASADASLLFASSRYDFGPKFSPDGERLVFVSDSSGDAELWVANSDGSEPRQITAIDGLPVGSPQWSPDGERIVFDISEEHMDLYEVDAGGGLVRRLTSDPWTQGGASWSRDGRWVYYSCDADGPFGIRKMPAAGGPSTLVVEEGRKPVESPDGKWLYFAKSYHAERSPGIWRVPVDGGEEEQVLQEGLAGRWALSQSGIYLLKAGAADRLPTIELFRYETWDREVVHEFPKHERFGIYNALAVSEDDRSIAFVQYNDTEADLMLVEDFR